MRKCFFILTLLILKVSGFSQIFKGFYISTDQNFSIYDNSSKNSWNTSISSISVDFRDCTLKLAWKIPTTKFSSSPQINPPAAAGSFYFKELFHFPLELKIGQIKASGSISNLRSPGLSSAGSGFFSNGTNVTCLKAAFPSSSDYSKPLACFAEYPFSFLNNTIRLTINAFTSTKSEFEFSTLFDYRINKKTELAFSTTGGLFLIQNMPEKWFSQQTIFKGKNCWCQNFQILFKNPFFYSKAVLNILEQPHSPVQTTFQSENAIFIKNFSLNISIFSASPNELFTINSSVIDSVFQLRINPQFILIPESNKFYLKTGFLFYAQESISSDFQYQFLFKNILSVLLKTKAFHYEFHIKLFNIEETLSNSTFTASFSVQNRTNSLFPTRKASFQYKFKDNSTVSKLGFSIVLPQKNSLSIKLNTSISTVQQNISSALLELKLSQKLIFNNCTLQFSAGIKFNKDFS